MRERGAHENERERGTRKWEVRKMKERREKLERQERCERDKKVERMR